MKTPQQVAQDVAQTPSMRHNPTPRTDAATYPADCLGKTLVVHRDCAAALEIELHEAEQIDNAANHYLSRAESAEAKLTELKAINKTGAERLQFVLTENSRLRAENLVAHQMACGDVQKWAAEYTADLAAMQARAENAKDALIEMKNLGLEWARLAGEREMDLECARARIKDLEASK
jgi:hypothetical protein